MCLQVNIEDGAMMVCRGSHRMRSFAKLKAGYGQTQVQTLRCTPCLKLIIIQCGGHSHSCANLSKESVYFGCDWPIVHSIPQWLPAQTYIPAEAKILPYDGALAFALLLKNACVILDLTSVA